MAMVVKNNMSAVRTLNTLNSNTSALQKSLQKVSSGMKINSAQDDASGYAISERMRVRIRSLDQANQNTQNDASLMKTAEGAVGNTVEILRALKEKAINAANDSNTDEDRQTIQKEINQFIDQIDDNALVQFNGKYLIDGSKNNATVSSKTILLNQSLKAGTLESAALTELANRAGDSLGIQTSDKWQVSWVENGNITFASGTVGDKTLEQILSASWTDDSGNEFAQVAATTDEGLISAARPNPRYGSLGDSGDGTSIPAKILEKIKNYEGFTDGTSAVFTFEKLGLYGDEEGGEFKYDASSYTGLDTATSVPTITYDGTASPDASKFSISGLKNNTPIYGDEYVDTENQIIETTTDLKTASLDVTDTASLEEGSFAADLVAYLPYSDLTGSAISRTATASLSTIIGNIKNADGTQKYYLTEDGSAPTDDVILKLTRTGTGLGNTPPDSITSDVVTFVQADGSTALANKTPLYKLNENYKEDTGEGTGFTDAWDKFGKEVYTPDKTSGIAVAASGEGVNKQLSGLTISILDQDGNVKKAANAALDQFKQYQRAENQTGDMSLNFHIGSEANVAIKVGMSDMRSEALGLKGSDGVRLDVYTKEHANSAINVIENALTKALDQQTTIGAIEARLEYTSTNLTTSSENVQAAESTIRDADMAKEMTNYTKSNVLLQAAQAMLAQANQNSSAVLSLLQ